MKMRADTDIEFTPNITVALTPEEAISLLKLVTFRDLLNGVTVVGSDEFVELFTFQRSLRIILDGVLQPA